MSQVKGNDVRDDIERYSKSHNLEPIINSLIGEIISKKPDNIVSYLIQYTYRLYPDDAKAAVLKINHEGFPHNDPKAKDAPILARRSSKGGENQTADLEGQAAIDQYLAAVSAEELLRNVVEGILFSKPRNVCAFIVDHLCRTFPDDGKEAIRRINKKLAVEDESFQEKEAPDTAATAIGEAGSNEGKDADAAEEDSSDDDDDDYLPEELPEVAAAPKKAVQNRRVSVSAESMDPAKLKEQVSQVTYITKAPEVAQSLVKVINKSAMLKRMCEPEQRKLLVKAFAGPVFVPAGEDIIKQGEEGDLFYLLEAGKVDVFVEKNAVKAKVHEYRAGDAFGQLALMYNAPRAATCTATEDVKLWTLDRVSFRVIIVAAAMQKREIYKHFLSQVPILETLTEMEIMTLADSLSEETYEDGAIVCQQGDEGNDFYIIKEGFADCFKNDDSTGNVEEFVASLQAGHYFGEIALLTPKPRQATVKAKGKLKVLAIDRATFTRVFGSMDSILKRKMTQYEKFTSD